MKRRAVKPRAEKRRAVPAMIHLLAVFGLVFALAQRGLAEDAAPSEEAPPPPVSGKLPPNAAPPPRTGAGTGMPDARSGAAAPDANGAAAAPANAAKSPGKAAAAAGRIHLSAITPLATTVSVHPKVLEECRLQTLLPQSIAERNSDVVLSDAKGGMKLDLKIVDIHAPSGGVFSGPKWITVHGKLTQGKTVKGNFIAKETSMASATACGMLSKVITVLGGDIAQWLRSPSKDSLLGSAR